MCGHTWPEAGEPLLNTDEQPPRGKQGPASKQAKEDPPSSREVPSSVAQTMDIAAAHGDRQVLMGFVAVYEGGLPAGAFWPLYSGSKLVGRAGGGAQPDIVVNAPSVSARHAQLDCNRHTGMVILNDLGARNGTHVNGVQVRSGGSRPLVDNDRVRLGQVELVVKLLPRNPP
jgi:pSer/pThr/pTyr-binding forkhead associated (FHA) protein